MGEVKSENEEEDTEEKKKRPHFWKGFAAGAGAMFLVAGAVFCVTNGVVDRLFYPENAGSLSLSGLKTSRKLSELSNVINYYYLNDIDGGAGGRLVVQWGYGPALRILMRIITARKS